MQTQYMQQGYYPYAYTTSAQQAGGVRKYPQYVKSFVFRN